MYAAEVYFKMFNLVIDKTFDFSSFLCQLSFNIILELYAGTCISNGTSYGSTFKIVCDSGHELLPDISMLELKCLEAGRWSEAPAKNQCLPIHCPAAPHVSHATIISNNTARYLVIL